MRHFLHSIAYASLLCSSAFASAPSIQSADDITYEWLTGPENSQTGYVDHIPLFREIFSHYKVGILLEFGLGFSTKYFLDSCDKVISIEFVTNGCGPEWMKYCLSL